jgi:hypothetical protein
MFSYHQHPRVFQNTRSIIQNYRLYRSQARDTFGQAKEVFDVVRGGIHWLNNLPMSPTGIPFIDETFDAIRRDPIYGNILREVDGFYYRIEHVERVAEDINDALEQIGEALIGIDPQLGPQRSLPPTPRVPQGAGDPAEVIPNLPVPPSIPLPIPQSPQSPAPTPRPGPRPPIRPPRLPRNRWGMTPRGVDINRLRRPNEMFPRFDESPRENINRWVGGLKTIYDIYSILAPLVPP